mgnify:CR=1 FL=1
MKRYALYHLDEELYLVPDTENNMVLDSDSYLFTKDELEYVFDDEEDTSIETITIDGDVYNREDFDIIVFDINEEKRLNFKDFNL